MNWIACKFPVYSNISPAVKITPEVGVGAPAPSSRKSAVPLATTSNTAFALGGMLAALNPTAGEVETMS